MQFKKKYKLKNNINHLKDIFGNLKSYGKYHPLIKNVILVNSKNSSKTEYIVKEQPFNWIPIRIKYLTVVRQKNNKIEYQIKKIPLTKVSFEYEFLHIGELECEVEFKLSLKSKLLGKRIFLQKMINAQEELMNNILEEEVFF
jgi:ribosome-associated toxin RatA of RatAB toxin-antitoxin module